MAALAPPPENLKDWHKNTTGNIGYASNSAEKMLKAIEVLEKKEADEQARAKAKAEAEKAEAERLLQEQKAAKLKKEEEEKQQQLQAAERFRKQEEAKAAAADARKLAAAFEAMRREHDDQRLQKDKDYANIVMNDVKKRIGASIVELLHECRTKFSLLKVCEQRLEMRDKRPPADLFKDHVTDALENERKLLKSARDQLAALTKEGEQIIAEIQDVQHWLSTGPCRDNVVARKKRAMTPANDGSRVMKSASLPSLPSATGFDTSSPPSPTFGCSQRLYRSTTRGLQMDKVQNASARDLLGLGEKLVEKGFAFYQKALDAIEKTSQDCNGAGAHTNASLDKRQAEYDGLKKELNAKVNHVSNVIKEAEKWISKLKKRDLLLPPDAKREDNKELKAAEDALAELRASKAKVDDDYRAKHLAWKIDVSCRTLVPIRIDARDPLDRPENRNTLKAMMSGSPSALQSSGFLSLDAKTPKSPTSPSKSLLA